MILKKFFNLFKSTKKVEEYVYYENGKIEEILDLIINKYLDLRITDRRYLDLSIDSKIPLYVDLMVNEINSYMYKDCLDEIKKADTLSVFRINYVYSFKEQCIEIYKKSIFNVDEFNEWFVSDKDYSYSNKGIYLRLDKLSNHHIMEYLEEFKKVDSNYYEPFIDKFYKMVIEDWINKKKKI